MRLSFLILLINSYFLFGCAAKGESPVASQPMELPVLQISSRDTTLERTYVATVNACQNVELRAKAAGFLEKITVDEGQFVRKGQTLFQLNADEARVQMAEATALLASARADAKAAEVELGRVQTLVKKNVLTSSESELAKARLAAANAKVQEALAREEKARIKLSYTIVRAPFSGIIDRIPHKTGSLIAEGSLLTTLSDIKSMHVYFNVSENEYLHYVKSGQLKNKTGQPVALILADGALYKENGKIETMEGEFESSTGSIAFRASFPNPAQLLKHGASGKVMIRSTIPNAILIPQKSVMEVQDKNYVFVVTPENTVKMRNIELDTRLEDLILVKSGLQDGDKILYEGVQNVKEGNKVRPRLLTLSSLAVLRQK